MKKIVLLGLLVATASGSFLQDLNLGLVGHFRFNGNATDESVSNIDGVVSNATLTAGVNGAPNTAYAFNGTTSYIDFGVSNRGVSDVITISYWVKTNTTVTQYPITKYDWSEDAGYNSVLVNGYVGTAGRDGSGTFHNSGYSTTPIADNQWHHVVSVVDVNSWEIWVDCNLESSITTATGSPDISGTQSLILGKWGYENSYHFTGSIDEVRIYNRALTPAEMALLCDDAQFFTSIDNQEDAGSFSVYPNPAEDRVFILLPADRQLEITNVLGEVVFSTVSVASTTLTLDISGWAKGIYLVNLFSSEGTLSRKLVIQ